MRERNRLPQVFREKGSELVPRDEIRPVVKIHVTGTRNDDEFLGFAGEAVGLLAEFLGVSLVARDEQQGARR